MQIKNVKISNLISFPYIQNLDKNKGISFSVSKNGNVHTLIGPNGSGKSSFLEIINQLFKVGLTKDYIFDKAAAIQDTITEHVMSVHNLRKNFFAENKKSEVQLTLSLKNNDYDNLGFVCKFADQLNEIIKKYSQLDVRFSSFSIEKIQKISELNVCFEIDIEKKAVVLDEKNLNAEEKFILHFVQHQELIQICMNIYNDFEREKGSREWYPLKNTYAILGSNRRFGNMLKHRDDFFSFSPGKRSRYISGQNTKTYYSISIGYYLCLMKFWEILSSKHKQAFAFANNDLGEVYQEIYKKELLASEFFQGLNGMIQKYLDMSLDLGFEDGNFVFNLVDRFEHVYAIDALSSGDQSFLFIIITIFGYDLNNGLLIIDEPELHLHPQMQKQFMSFIEQVSERYALQIILATHSPLMINEKNIRHVYRFSNYELKTHVNNPAFRIFADDAELIHMLRFENIAKIFFVDKIIMVEGDTDAYFFDFYLQHLKSIDPRWEKKVRHYEFLNIQGKGSFPKWKKFLKKFGIRPYFIGDWDNVVDANIISQQQMDHYRKLSHKQYDAYIKKYKFLSKRRYGVLVETIKITAKSLFEYIVEQIESLYKKDVFFLKKGDLETYTGMQTKGLDDTIFFCQKRFSTWVKDPKFAEHRKELDEILEQIFLD